MCAYVGIAKRQGLLGPHWAVYVSKEPFMFIAPNTTFKALKIQDGILGLQYEL